MSFTENVANLFRPANRQPPPVVHDNPADKNKPQLNPAANPAYVPPNNQSNPTTPPEPISPLDAFKDLWKTTTPNGKAPTDPFAQPLLNADPAKLAEATSKLNFSSAVPEDVLKKALAGDHTALAQAINIAAQQAFLASSTLSTQMVEGATKTNNGRMDSVLEAKFKNYLVNNERSENPVLQHASAAPMLDLAKRQLLTQHPDKSPQEIQAMAENYLVSFGQELMGQKQKNEAKAANPGPDGFDFSNYV